MDILKFIIILSGVLASIITILGFLTGKNKIEDYKFSRFKILIKTIFNRNNFIQIFDVIKKFNYYGLQAIIAGVFTFAIFYGLKISVDYIYNYLKDSDSKNFSLDNESSYPIGVMVHQYLSHSFQEGIDLAIEEINSKKSSQRKPYSAYYYFSSDPRTDFEKFTFFNDNEIRSFILGLPTPSFYSIKKKVSKENRVVNVVSTYPDLRKFDKGIISVYPPDTTGLDLLLNKASLLRDSMLVFITPAFVNYEEKIKSKLSKCFPKFILLEYDTFMTTLFNINQYKQTNILFIGNYEISKIQTKDFLKILKTPRRLYALTSLLNVDNYNLSKNILEYGFITNKYTTIDSLNFTEQFFSRWKNKHHRIPDPITVAAYDGMILLDQLIQIGNYDQIKELKNKLETNPLYGAIGRLQIDSNFNVKTSVKFEYVKL